MLQTHLHLGVRIAPTGRTNRRSLEPSRKTVPFQNLGSKDWKILLLCLEEVKTLPAFQSVWRWIVGWLVNNFFKVCEGKDAWFNLRYWTVSYMGCCEKPRKMPASIAGVSAEIRTGHLQTKPEALPLGDRSEATIGLCSCRYGACFMQCCVYPVLC